MIKATEPGELIATLPHLLGFYPAESLILITLHGQQRQLTIGQVLRADLPETAQETDLANRMALLLGRHPSAAVILTVVGGGTSPAAEPPRADLVQTVARALFDANIPVLCSFWVAAIQGGQRWRDYYSERGGLLPDPRYTVTAATSAATGAITHSSRDDLASQLALDIDDATVARRAAGLAQALDSTANARRTSDRPDTARVRLATVDNAVRNAQHHRYPTSDDEVVALTVALSDRLTRDISLGHLIDEASALAAEHLWLALVRATPAPWRAEPAALLALSTYLRGDGAMASIAVETALAAAPGHPLAELVNQLLDQAMPRRELADLIALAVAEARSDLNPPAAAANHTQPRSDPP